MTVMRRLAAGAAIVALGWASIALAGTTVIHAGSLIRDADADPSGPATIVVTDGRIVSVDAGTLPGPAGAAVVDLPDRTVMPGLVDLHVHLTGDPDGDFWKEAIDPPEWGVVLGAKNARLTAKAGFTTVREAGSAQHNAYALRRGTAEGIIPGPRIVAAGPALSIVGGHADVSGFLPEVNAALSSGYTCTGPVECAEKVRRASQNGADVIKITATGGVLSQQGRGLGAHFSDAELAAIMDTAHSLGLKVMAHAHGAGGILAAARAGVDTIDHGSFADDAGIAEMKKHGSVLVPTLLPFVAIAAKLGTGFYTPVVEAKIRETQGFLGQAVRRARKAGVPVAFGTDAGVFPHGENAKEFGLLLDAGMTSREAVRSATLVAADVLDLENEIGRIAPGYSADMIALEGNPLENARLLERVDWVMARGRVIE